MIVELKKGTCPKCGGEMHLNGGTFHLGRVMVCGKCFIAHCDKMIKEGKK